MAMKLNAGEVGRGDYFFIDPQEIVVDEKLNGRAWPHDEESVASMAKSFEEDGGQLQPVQVRRIAENKVQLVLGYRRYNAALLYNKLHPDKPMKLKAIVVQINDEEALKRNIVENHERRETTPVDDAYAQRRLREDYGWTDTKIAEFYRCSPPYVGVLKKLLTLPTKVQRLVHGRELSVQAATSLADLPPDEQAHVLASLLPGEQSVSVPMTTEQPTAHDHPVGEQAPIPSLVPDQPAPVAQVEAKQETLSQALNRKVRESKVSRGGKQARTLKEVRAFFEGLTGPAEKPGVKKLAELVVKFIQGGMVDKTMTKHINALFPNAATEPEQEPEETTESGHEPTQEPEPMPVNQDVPAGAVA